MDQSRQREIDRIVELARAANLGQRDAVVDRECGDDQGLKSDVYSRLLVDQSVSETAQQTGVAAHSSSGEEGSTSFTATADSSVRAVGEDAQHLIGTTVDGRFHILDVLGEGGFGIVYLAAQSEPIQRKVALKILKPGMDSRQIVGRFEMERQTLAMMNHPGIAKVLDGGSTESGRAYFVMEYVKGEPVTEYCSRHKLPTSSRLDLFARICDAVHHAHQKGVIHRDIKPSNVLVEVQQGADPRPKVIDFGVAKAISAPNLEASLQTRIGQIIGTPEYMSPEQAEMSTLDIDTRSDVYSLGVLLYELLTGARPYDLKMVGLMEMQRYIREVDPPKPSTRLSSLGESASTIASSQRTRLPELTKILRNELDWIPLMALRKDRTERYDSAAALAQDVRNYLDGRPLVAGPESAIYRARKFMKRNRAGVAAGVAILTSLVLGLAGTSVGLIAANREADRANRQTEIAETRYEQLQRFVQIPSRFSASATGYAPAARRAVLATIVELLEEVDTDQADDRLRRDLAIAYRETGSLALESDSVETSLDAFNTATSLLDRTASESESSEDRLDRLRLGIAHASALQVAARDADALDMLDGVSQAAAEVEGADGASPQLDLIVATSHRQRGSILARDGQAEEARGELDSAVGMLTALAANPAFAEKAGIEQAAAHASLSYIAQRGEESDEAESQARLAVEVLQRISGDQAGPGIEQALAESLERLGRRLMDKGDIDAAGGTYARVREIAESRLVQDPMNTDALELLERSYEQFGDLAIKVKDYERAREHFTQFARRAGQLYAQDPLDRDRLSMVTKADHRLGDAFRRLEELDRAASAYGRALNRLDVRFDEGLEDGVLNGTFLRIAFKQGLVLARAEREQDAEQAWRRALPMGSSLEEAGSLSKLDLAYYSRLVRNLGYLALARADQTHAEYGEADQEDVAEAVRRFEQAMALDGRREPRILRSQARAYAHAGQWDRAVEFAEESLRRLNDRQSGSEDGLDEAAEEVEAYRRGSLPSIRPS